MRLPGFRVLRIVQHTFHFDGFADVLLGIYHHVVNLCKDHRTAHLGQIDINLRTPLLLRGRGGGRAVFRFRQRRLRGGTRLVCTGDGRRVNGRNRSIGAGGRPAGAGQHRNPCGKQQANHSFHPDTPPVTRPIIQKPRNTAKSTATMVAPTGVPPRMEISMPVTAPATDNTAAQTVTARKF